ADDRDGLPDGTRRRQLLPAQTRDLLGVTEPEHEPHAWAVGLAQRGHAHRDLHGMPVVRADGADADGQTPGAPEQRAGIDERVAMTEMLADPRALEAARLGRLDDLERLGDGRATVERDAVAHESL